MLARLDNSMTFLSFMQAKKGQTFKTKAKLFFPHDTIKCFKLPDIQIFNSGFIN